MHLPYLGDETREVRDDLARRLAAVVELALIDEVADERLLDRRRVAVGDGIVLQHPFALADVDRAELARRRQDVFEQLGMDGDEVFGCERKPAIVENGHDTFRDLVRLLLLWIWPRHLGLRRIVIVYPPARLVLRDAPFDVILGRIEEELRRRKAIDLLKADGGGPGVGAFAPPGLLGLEVASQLSQYGIIVRHQLFHSVSSE